LGQNLTHDPTLHGFLQYVGLFMPVVWVWAGFTFYANRFDTDDLTYRLLVLLAMFAVAALATNTPDAIDKGGRGFAISFIFVRLVLLALYARAIRYVPSARRVASVYFAAFSLGVVIWLVSLLIPPPGRWWFWAAALVLELGVPFYAWRRVPGAPVDPRHLPERFGLLTIIVLGESVLGVVLAAGGFLAAAAVWWIYFDYLDESVVSRGSIAGLVFTYAHFPVIIGIGTLGVGVKFEILAAAGNPNYEDTGWVLCAGVALCMIGLAAIHLATPPTLFDADAATRLATAALALVLLAFSFVLPPLALVWTLTALLVAQVIFELGRHEEHAGARVELDL